MTGSCYVILTLSHYIGTSVIGECLSRTRYSPGGGGLCFLLITIFFFLYFKGAGGGVSFPRRDGLIPCSTLKML